MIIRLVILISFIVAQTILKAQDYSLIKNSLVYSKTLKKAKTYNNLDKAIKNADKVVSLKINFLNDSSSLKLFNENISHFHNLRKLVIDNFFDYEVSLTEEIWNLNKLEFVSLHNIRIDGFNNLNKLTKLKYLSLLGSRLSDIPIEIYELINLEYLDLTLNKISDIPIDITNLTKLRELDLTNNCLSKIPESVTLLSALEYLDINNAETGNYFRDGTPFCKNTLTLFPNMNKLISIKQINIYKVEIKNEIIAKQIEQYEKKVFKK